MGGFSNDDKRKKSADIKIKKGKDIAPHFSIYQGKDEERKEYTQFEGYLIGVKLGSYVWDNKTKKQVIFTFVANGEEIEVKSGYTGVMRSMVNSLAGKKLGMLDVSLYSKNKDGKDRARVGILSDGERLGWKYEISELPKVKEIPIPGQDSAWDSTELDARIEEIIEKDIIPNLGPAPVEPLSKTGLSTKANGDVDLDGDKPEPDLLDQVRKEKETKEVDNLDEDSSDLPF